MAFYPELKGVALDARNTAIQKMVEKAMRETGLPYKDLVVRPLIPTDLGNGGGTWETIEVTTTLAELHNVTVAQDTWLSIYGISLQPSLNDTGGIAGLSSAGSVNYVVTQALNREEIQRLRISRKGTVAREWTVNMIPGWTDRTGYVDDPIIVDQNTNITTSFVATSGSTLDQDSYAFLGDVVEKRGITINP